MLNKPIKKKQLIVVKKKDKVSSKFNTENSSDDSQSQEKITPLVSVEFPVLTCNSIELVQAQESTKTQL